MPVPFACPHCGEQTLVDEQYAGHSGPCIACGKPIVVPHFGARLAAVAGGDDAARPAPARWLVWGLCGLAAFVAVTALAVMITAPLFQAAGAASTRRACAANLRRIHAAIEQYELVYHTLPPAVVTDASGKPLYSWRVLILPYLGREERALYSQFQLDQPWDSPANSRLIAKMPAVFRSPGDTSAGPGHTSYLVVAGNSTPFPPNRPMSRSEIIDGPYATILVVEAAATGITWSEPKDLRDNQLSFQIGVDLGGSHSGGANVLFADGKVRFLPDTTTTDEIAELITAAGREVPSMDY